MGDRYVLGLLRPDGVAAGEAGEVRQLRRLHEVFSKDGNFLEYWSLREFFLNLGRISGYTLLLLVGLTKKENLLYYLMIVLAFSIIITGYIVSNVKKYNSTLERSLFSDNIDINIFRSTQNVNLDTSTIKLLNTEKSIFHEGKSMCHCLYSCYYERIKCHQYIAFHMTFPESCTFSVKLNHNNEVIMDQIYAKYDKHVSTETEFIAQQFIDANYDILRRMLTKEQVYL